MCNCGTLPTLYDFDALRRASAIDFWQHRRRGDLPNHLNYAPPSTDVTSSTFGKITSVQAAENAGNRTGQVALRIEF